LLINIISLINNKSPFVASSWSHAYLVKSFLYDEIVTCNVGMF